MLTESKIIYLEAEVGYRDLYTSFTTSSSLAKNATWNVISELFSNKLRKVGIANAALESL